ncbi:protein phosphatase 2C domain-containing protein [Streptomyces collinus]
MPPSSAGPRTPPESPGQPPDPGIPGSRPAPVPPPPAAPPAWPAADPPGKPASPAPAAEPGGAASRAAGFGEAAYPTPAARPPVPPRPAAPPASSPPADQSPPRPPGPGSEPSNPADQSPLRPSGAGSEPSNLADQSPLRPSGAGSEPSNLAGQSPLRPSGAGSEPSNLADQSPSRPSGAGSGPSNPADQSPSRPPGAGSEPSNLADQSPSRPSGPGSEPSNPADQSPSRPSGPGSEPSNPADQSPEPPDPPAADRIERPADTRARGHVGTRPPTYDAEPTALPAADPDDLDDLVADTVLDGARYGACTLRAVSVRGDSARYRGEPRRDALLTARFGTGERALLLVAMATGARATPGAHRAAAEACHWIGRAVGRSHARLVEDIRDGRRGDLKSGLHRLTDRSLGKLRASASEQGVDPGEYAASLRCLLLSADPGCRTRVFFGVGPGGLFRLREGEWQDIEPQVADVKGEPVLSFGSPPSETPEGDRLTMDLGIPTPPSPYEPAPEPPREPFRFRTSVARPGDTLLMCSGGLAEPLRGEPELGEYLAERWSRPDPPGLAAFLADSQVRVKGYADDRTAAAVWEA